MEIDQLKQLDSKNINTVPQPIINNVSELNLKQFLTLPVTKELNFQCTVKRIKHSLGSVFYPKFRMAFSESNEFLLSAKRKSWNMTSNYLITQSQDKFSTSDPGFLGKVRANFLGTSYQIYDNGVNPKKVGQNGKQVRQQLGVITFSSKIMKSKSPRDLKIFIPEVNAQTNEPVIFQPLKKSESIQSKFKVGMIKGIKVFFNRQPKWSEKHRAFILNFHGRVTKPSVKNFQLVDEQNEDHIYLQFGKCADEEFNLDFQWPFSPLQAFGIALASFDSKIACD